MAQPWPIIAVADVPKSTAWYASLLDAHDNHPGSTEFNQILDADGTMLVCLRRWDASGPGGEPRWPSLADPESGRAGNGLLLWFVVTDFDAVWQRVQRTGVSIHEPPNRDNGTNMRAFVVRDPDGYHVAINEAQPGSE